MGQENQETVYSPTVEQDRLDYHAGLSSVDSTSGREILFSKPLYPWLSEGALHKNRAAIEIGLLIALSDHQFPNMPVLTDQERATLCEIQKTFDARNAADYDHFGRKGIAPVEHDVKAVELTLREAFDEHGLNHLKEWIHFPATSEDVNNLAWNIGLRGAINHVWLPKVMQTCDYLAARAREFASIPVLGRTHGMPATPTTFGKRFAYFLDLVGDVLSSMQHLELSGKFSGPTGNHNAVLIAAPDFDFETFARRFVESYGFTYKECAHQRNSHVQIKQLLDAIVSISIIAADLCESVRLGVMFRFFNQRINASHTGSSVMPHKVNPWLFEVAQGYFEQAIALMNAAGSHLIQSWFERDLTDHPWEREYGSMFAKSLIGFTYLNQGLASIMPDPEYASRELQEFPEVLTEALQISARMLGIENAYMQIKEASRDKALSLDAIHKLIDQIIPDDAVAARLKALRPENYTGHAEKIARRVADKYDRLSSTLRHGLLHPFAGISVILFDFDGTLHFGDKAELHERLSAINQALNMGLTDSELRQIGSSSSRFDVMKEKMLACCEGKKYGITLELMQIENDKVTGNFDHLLTPATGAKEFLGKLRERGYQTGIVSTRGKQSLDRIAAKHGFTEHVHTIVSYHSQTMHGNELRAKPHPEPIALALKKLKAEPGQAMYVGDLQIDDIIAAKALGMKTVLINEDTLDPYGAIPDFHFKNFKAFTEYFESVTQ